jgi:sulfate permease, SulP family
MNRSITQWRIPGDAWGGFAAMLVALPASIAFGVTIYAAISPQFAAFGAFAGVLGAIAIGLIAPTLGGTDRLISAPCAPAAAVLSAFAIEMVTQGTEPQVIVLLMTMLAIIAGLLQVLLGLLGVGKLIKYIPYPVVSGYLTAVGLIIIGSQIGKFAGADPDERWWEVLLAPADWDQRALVIGASTVVVALLAQRITKFVPGTILGLIAGVVAYHVLAAGDPALGRLDGNPLVLGEIAASGEGYLAIITGRWQEIGELRLSQIAGILGSALTLAALLSIDTLKTCVVLDQMTHSRHDPNRELVAQGVGNIASAAIGGIPGAGTMGATLINVTSGAKTRSSGIVEGVMVLLAALLLGPFIAWVPISSLAGLLIVIGLRMIDLNTLRYLESRATVFDFAVVVTVVGMALTVGLIAASGAGVALAILLFVREQVGGSVIRRKTFVNQRSSTWYRPEEEMRVLEAKGDAAVIFELQGSLFFGTTNQLQSALEPELRTRDFVILDLHRVQSIDVTAAHMLNLVRDALHERKVPLLLSGVRETLPNGVNLREFLEHSGLLVEGGGVLVFPTLELAIEHVEDTLLGDLGKVVDETPLQLQDMEIFKGRKGETLGDLEACLVLRTFRPGDRIYAMGETAPELYLIRKGEIRILSPIGGSRRTHHIATFGRGDFFGGLAFLDGRPRSNDAVAHSETELYVLTLDQFNKLAETHKRLAFTLLQAIARTLAIRLRHADGELTLMHE